MLQFIYLFDMENLCILVEENVLSSKCDPLRYAN